MIWPDLPAASTLYAHMPRTPLTGDRKGDHFFLPLEQSLQHPYTQFNRTWKGFVIRNTITIDIDEPMAALEAEYGDTFRRDRPSYRRLLEMGQAMSNARAESLIAPSTQEALPMGLSCSLEDEMPCNCTD